jgi:protein-S-isoprenylcysteine O-methyltransferase Ste14
MDSSDIMRRELMVALKTLIFTILGPGTLLVIIPWLLLWGTGGHLPIVPSLFLVGLLPLLLGVALYCWCAGAFTFLGKRTPALIDVSRVLLKGGAYRWVRNPMYLAFLIVIIAEAILFRSFLLLGYALLLWIIFHLLVVFIEEPALRRQLGASYETYCQTVPRWLPRRPSAQRN